MEIKGFSLVLGGEAGQGIQLIETVLVRVAKESGCHVFATKEYMSRIRGGINTSEIRLGSERLMAHVDRIDLLVPLKSGVIGHLGRRVSDTTLIIGEQAALDGFNGVVLSFTAIATEIGNKLYANAVALGAICGLLDLDRDSLIRQIKKYFLGKEGVIDGYEVRLNPGRFASSQIAFVQVLVREQADTPCVGEQLAAIPQIQEVHYIAGEDCYLIKIRAADTVELGRLLRTQVAGIEGVIAIKTAPVLATYKETARIPIP